MGPNHLWPGGNFIQVVPLRERGASIGVIIFAPLRLERLIRVPLHIAE